MPNFVPVVYSGGAPVLASSGAQRVACAHLVQWLQAYDALQVFRGRGHVVYYQAMGGADASAGTHTCGSAWDMSYTGIAAIMDAREMGAASWPRLHSNGWVGAEHVHSLINCGDNGCNLYQYAAYLSGRNGLGKGGLAGKDPLSRPATIRTWQDGIAWAQAQMGITQNPTQEDDMAVFQLIGGVGIPAYIASGSGAVATIAEPEIFAVAQKLAKGDSASFTARERDVALNILARLRESQAQDRVWPA